MSTRPKGLSPRGRSGLEVAVESYLLSDTEGGGVKVQVAKLSWGTLCRPQRPIPNIIPLSKSQNAPSFSTYSKPPTEIPDRAFGARGESKYWKQEGWRGTICVCELVPTVIRIHAGSKYRHANTPTVVAAHLKREKVKMGGKQHCQLKKKRLSKLFPVRVWSPAS